MIKKCLKDYVGDGRYTIAVAPSTKSLMIKIKELYLTAVVTTSDADGIRGKKLLVDKWVADGLGLKAALPKYRAQDIVCENFTKQFVEGGNVAVNSSSKLRKGWGKAFNQTKQTTNESLRSSFIGYVTDVHAHPHREQGDEDYIGYGKQSFEGNVWEQKRQDILDSNKPLAKESVSFYLNGEIPKLYIKDREVGVVPMTAHYVTDSDMLGTNVITFVYMTKDDPRNKVLSIGLNNGRVFNQWIAMREHL